MKNLFATNKPLHIDIAKWFALLLIVAATIGAIVYGISVRQQLWFAATDPSAVTACMEGYYGELGEAKKRFEQKQRGQLINPLVEEVKKE